MPLQGRRALVHDEYQRTTPQSIDLSVTLLSGNLPSIPAARVWNMAAQSPDLPVALNSPPTSPPVMRAQNACVPALDVVFLKPISYLDDVNLVLDICVHNRIHPDRNRLDVCATRRRNESIIGNVRG